MGSVIKKLPKEPFSCQMCKKYSIGRNKFIYKSFELPNHPSEEMFICLSCAKREHGIKNKVSLENHLSK